MSSPNDSIQDSSSPEQPAPGTDQANDAHSGEGAASALAQLKSQVRQHRRQAGGEAPEEGGAGHAQ